MVLSVRAISTLHSVKVVDHSPVTAELLADSRLTPDIHASCVTELTSRKKTLWGILPANSQRVSITTSGNERPR